MSIRFNPVSSDISRWQWEINVPYQYLGGVMKISQLIYHIDRLYYSGKLNGFFFKYVISLLNFGRNYFRTSHLFLMFKNSSSQHQRKICVITTQLLDDKIRRKNPNLYKVHIFLHGRVWISWLLCTIPYSFCIIIKKKPDGYNFTWMCNWTYPDLYSLTSLLKVEIEWKILERQTNNKSVINFTIDFTIDH